VPGNAEAANALLERRRNLGEEILELSVVQLTLLQETPLVSNMRQDTMDLIARHRVPGATENSGTAGTAFLHETDQRIRDGTAELRFCIFEQQNFVYAEFPAFRTVVPSSKKKEKAVVSAVASRIR
jgi:hydroxyacyl-ACP dehydratase HTD2-like protein with hotdog domain